MYKIRLHKSKLSLISKVSREVLQENLELSTGVMNDDFINDLFSVKLDAFIVSRLVENKNVIRYIKPQRFWDWLLRRPQKVEFLFNCRELLKNAPEIPEGKSILMYNIE